MLVPFTDLVRTLYQSVLSVFREFLQIALLFTALIQST